MLSYFPLLILLVDSGKTVRVTGPSEIPSGVSFKVLETNCD
jgi:hypothetical protein